MSNQFSNAFVRQMGRETAHSVYKEISSYNSEISSIDEKSFTTKFIWTNYLWFFVSCFFSFFFPFLMVIPFICGSVRLLSNKIRGHYRGEYNVYKYDGRCRGGRNYLGKSEGWIKAKKHKKDCTEEEIRAARICGAIEMGISLIIGCLFQLLWIKVMYS